MQRSRHGIQRLPYSGPPPLDIVSIATDDLGPKVTTLRDASDRILAALDEMLSRAWR